MAVHLSEPFVDPHTAMPWVGGGVAALLIFGVIIRVIDVLKMQNQQRIVTGIALSSGITLSVGLSPFGSFAAELAQIFDIIPTEYPEWVKAIVAVETILGLLYGIAITWEHGRWLAVISFTLALLGGITLLYAPIGGVFLISMAWVSMELSSANRW